MARRNKKVVDPKIGQDGAALTADRKKQLNGYVSEIERINDQKKMLTDEAKTYFESAKEAGFDLKAMRQIIKMRTWEDAKLQAHEQIVDVYRHALGMLYGTVFEGAARENATEDAA